MTKISVWKTAAAICAVLASGASASAQELPSGWLSTDVGATGAAGTAASDTMSLAVEGAGSDVWGAADAFRFAYTTLTGDGSIVSKVTSAEAVNAWTKAGVMMRETMDAGSRHAFMLVSPGKGSAFQRRETTAGVSESTSGGSGAAPHFVKITRAGSTFTAFKSADGVEWTEVGSDTIAMASTIYVGVAVSSHVKGVLATATFEMPTVEVEMKSYMTEPGELRVLHWNSHHGGTGTDGKYNPDRFATSIVQFRADVASLNEMDNQGQVDKIVNLLKTKTGDTWVGFYDGRGNALLSRLPVTGSSICVVNPSVGRKAAHISVLADGRPVNVWSAHLALDNSAMRVSEVTALVACGQEWSESRIVAGDFNAGPGTKELNLMGVTHVDAWTKAKAMGTALNYSGNCDGCTRNSRIDFVFTSKDASTLEQKSAQVIDTRDAKGVMPSDHKPLLVVYSLK